MSSFFFQYWPIYGVGLGRYTAGAIKFVSNIAGMPALSYCNFVCAALCVQVRHWACIIFNCFHVCSANSFLDISAH